MAKAQLASLIGQVIKKRRLMRLPTALGRDIDIVVRPSAGRRVEGR